MKHIKFRCSKLVRDHSPEHLSQGGAIVHKTKCHDKAELISYFKKKIVEEAAEVLESKDKEELLDELADCLEVIKGLLKQIEVSEEEMEEVRQKKLQKRGGFSKGHIVDYIELTPDSDWLDHFRKIPGKYPEFK